jgi:8-hydroxy-5-deazaflavin:NADPH oxidoreductase
MKVGVLGSGDVARALGNGFVRHGDDVMLGTRDTTKLVDWASEHGAQVGSFADAAAFGEVVVLAVRGSVAAAVLEAAGADNLAGKPVIDATNPLADRPAEGGVIAYYTDLDRSLMEQLQEQVPDAHLVKAFNQVGNQHMVDPAFEGGPPTMFICGDDADAKRVVTGILERFGWDVADLGGVQAARAIEPLCMLWCIPGLVEGRWDHAFKLLRQPAG